MLIRFAQASATFFTGTIHFERAHETFHSAMELLKTLDDKELYTRITPFLILMHFIRGNFQQALECYECSKRAPISPYCLFGIAVRPRRHPTPTPANFCPRPA